MSKGGNCQLRVPPFLLPSFSSETTARCGKNSPGFDFPTRRVVKTTPASLFPTPHSLPATPFSGNANQGSAPYIRLKMLMCSLDERTLSAVWPTTSRSYRTVPVVDIPRGKIGLRKAQVIRAKTQKKYKKTYASKQITYICGNNLRKTKKIPKRLKGSRRHPFILSAMTQNENLYNELDSRLDITEANAEWCDHCSQGHPAPLD